MGRWVNEGTLSKWIQQRGGQPCSHPWTLVFQRSYGFAPKLEGLSWNGLSRYFDVEEIATFSFATKRPGATVRG